MWQLKIFNGHVGTEIRNLNYKKLVVWYYMGKFAHYNNTLFMENEKIKVETELPKKNPKSFNGKIVTRLILTSLILAAFILVIAWSKLFSGYQPGAGLNFILYVFPFTLFLYWIYLLLLLLPDLYDPLIKGVSSLFSIISRSCKRQKRKTCKEEALSLPAEHLIFMEKYVCEDFRGKPVTLALADVLEGNTSGSRAILFFYCAQSMLKWINGIPTYSDAESCFQGLLGCKSNYYEQRKSDHLNFSEKDKRGACKALRAALKQHKK